MKCIKTGLAAKIKGIWRPADLYKADGCFTLRSNMPPLNPDVVTEPHYSCRIELSGYISETPDNGILEYKFKADQAVVNTELKDFLAKFEPLVSRFGGLVCSDKELV